MIAVTTTSRIDGCEIVAYKGTAQGATFEDLLKSAESLGANAILNTCYDDALDVDTLFHGSAVVIEPRPAPPLHLPREIPFWDASNQRTALPVEPSATRS
jgi:uncharacterized protein YbjQ (UPF0145 family)